MKRKKRQKRPPVLYRIRKLKWTTVPGKTPEEVEYTASNDVYTFSIKRATQERLDEYGIFSPDGKFRWILVAEAIDCCSDRRGDEETSWYGATTLAQAKEMAARDLEMWLLHNVLIVHHEQCE